MKARRFLLPTVLFLLASIALAACMDEMKYSKRAERSAEQRAQIIKAEISSLGTHAWAGEYFEGDGLGENVSFMLAPESGYLFEWHGCLGLYDRNYGEVSDKDGTITLTFTLPNEREGFEGIADAFIPVSWGQRKYLIPTDDIAGFCNDVNAGIEPRKSPFGHYLLRREDETKEATGNPVLPEKYRAYLLPIPIEAIITSVGPPVTRPGTSDMKTVDMEVSVDKGLNAGVLAGMEFHVVHPDGVVEWITVTSVDAQTSQGVMTQFGKDDPVPAVGWRISTRPPYVSNGR